MDFMEIMDTDNNNADDEEVQEEPTPHKMEEVKPWENEKPPEVLPISGSCALNILVHKIQKQILKEQSETITLAILKRREAESANQIAVKLKLSDDVNNEIQSARKKLAVLVNQRKLLEKQVGRDEDIAKQLNSNVQGLHGKTTDCIENWKRFIEKCEELKGETLKLKDLNASIAVSKKQYEEIEKKKAALKAKDPVIQEKINQTRREIEMIKNTSEDEAVNIQTLTDKKLEISNILSSKKEQATDLKNQISDEERKLDLKNTLHLSLEEKNTKLKELEHTVSTHNETIALTSTQQEETSTTLNNTMITIRNMEESIKLTRNNVETAKCAMEEVIQKTSEDIKISKDRYEALYNDLMITDEETNEKNEVLDKLRDDLLRLIEEKNSLKIQQLKQQENEEIQNSSKLQLVSRHECFEKILESRQKLMKRQEELVERNTATLFKMNTEKDQLIVDISDRYNMRNDLKDKTDRMRLMKAKLQNMKEMTSKNIAEKNLKIEDLKKRILKRTIEFAKPGTSASTVPTPKRICFVKRLSESSVTQTSTDSSEVLSPTTPAEELFEELKKK